MKSSALLHRTICISLLVLFLSILYVAIPFRSSANIVEQAVKISNQTITGATLQNDSILSLPLTKERTYIIDGIVYMYGPTISCNAAFEFPSDAIVKLTMEEAGGDTNIIQLSGENGKVGIGCGGIGDPAEGTPVHITGTVHMGNTSGSLQFQASSQGEFESVRVESGSFLRADKL